MTITKRCLCAAEVACVLEVSRQRVHQLKAEDPAFPAPYAESMAGPVWLPEDIDSYRDDRMDRRKFNGTPKWAKAVGSNVTSRKGRNDKPNG